MKRSDLLKGLIITAEVCGTELSEAAAEVIVRELETYPVDAVVSALKRCRREVTGRLSLAAIVARIDDGHPDAEEAWAICSRAHDEANTLVWTDEMSDAYGSVQGLVAAGDTIAARMAFKESYAAAVREARDRKRPARWTVSPGHDANGRNAPIQQAVERGRLTAEQGERMMLPDHALNSPALGGGAPASVAALIGGGET